MTAGSVPRHLLAFAVPLFAGNLLQQMYSFADSWISGFYLGDPALAAVGAGYPIVCLLIGLFSGFASGGTVVIAGHFGAGRQAEARRAAGTLYLSSLIAAVPVTVILLAVTRPLMRLMQVDPSFYGDACTYLLIICAGLISTVGYNVNAGILYGIGDSRSSLIFLAISTVLNIVLDFWFIAGLNGGIAGAAYATVAAQTVSWLCGTVYLRKRYPEYMPGIREWTLDRKIFSSIIRIGLPMGLSQALSSIASLFCVARINSFGEAYSASYNIGNKIDNFAWFAIQSLCSAVMTFTSQNAGVNDIKRVREGARWVTVFTVGVCLIFGVLIVPLRFALIGLFSRTPSVLEAGGEYLCYIFLGYPFCGVYQCLNSVMRGAGEVRVPMITSICGILLFRLPLIYIITDCFGPHYMYISYIGGWFAGFMITGVYYLSGRWTRHSLAKQLS